MPRLFVALVPDPAVRRELQRSSRSLGAALGEHGRALPASNYHITLVFLGNQGQSRMARVTTALGRAAALSGPLQLELDTLQLFPDCRKPSVLVARVVAGEGLLRLRKNCLAALQRAGLHNPPGEDATGDKQYRPHISLVRVRGLAGEAAAQWQQHHSLPLDMSVQFNAVTLLRSDPQESAASIYTPLAVFNLGPGQPLEYQVDEQ